MTELKNSIVEFNTKLDQVEGKISEHEDRAVQFIQSEEQKKIRMKNSEESLRVLWEVIKRPNIHIIGSQKEKSEKKKGSKRLLKKKKRLKTFLTYGRKQMKKAQTVP